jgi:hypothetical protein
MVKFDDRDKSHTAKTRKDKKVYKYSAPTKGQPWIWLPMDLLESVAFRSMCGNCYKVYFRIIHEQMAQRRKSNGALIVTFDQFKKAGISHNMVGQTLKKLKLFGLIRITRGWVGGEPAPNQFELTFLGNHEGLPATNDWKKCTQERVDKYLSDVRLARIEKASK